jgi:serine/threonine protein kinase
MTENYERIKEIGRGGMSTVYLAKQKSLGRMVAIKILRTNPNEDKEYIRRFFREARITASLNHPNIIQIFESNYSPKEGVFYIVTEFVEGGDFRILMNSNDGIELMEKFRIINKVLSALDYAHQKGIVHRDVKPSNILLTKKREPKLCDFGIATAMWGQESRYTRTNEVIGTMDYIAPEQKESSKKVDPRADIFSVGVILYELITGRKPQGAFPPPQKVVPSIPRELDDLVMKCLQPAPMDRFKSASNLGRELGRVIQQNTDRLKNGTGFVRPEDTDSPTIKLGKPVESDSLQNSVTQVDRRRDEFNELVRKLKKGTLAEKLNIKNRFLENIQPGHEELLLQLLREADSTTEGFLVELLIEALGAIKSIESCPFLIELLSDPYYNKAAATAIGEIGCVEAEEKLFNILLARTERSYIALRPLGKLQSMQSVELIAEYLSDQHTWIRELALDALSMIEDERVISYLENITNKDTDANIRAKSKKILWRIKK